ncbi:MAG TPA: SRPBCC family protein [Candidatus Angelobacter sp.]|nr:SRPBCC family protein [Candidatus Angelobacter sp.]
MALVLVCVLVLAAMKPARFTVARSITVQAPPEKVLALINDLQRWQDWQEGTQANPDEKRTYSGAAAGKGAVGAWDGKSGKVRLEIVESAPTMVRVQADWERPFKACNFNVFSLEPAGPATRLTWTLDGENVFMLRAMTVFVSTERLMGGHLEKGLAALKVAAER